MDWGNERYVRLYTRDTPEWLCLPWQGRALLPLIIRKADRAGVIETKIGARGICALVGMPLEVVDAGLAALLEDGCVRAHPLGYVVPNFLEAQEAPSTPAERQRKHREVRRDMVNAGLVQNQRTPVVYFIQAENGGPVKIGYADELAKRVVNLQVAVAEKLCILGTIPGDQALEAELHRKFASTRIRGEWFADSSELMDFIKSQTGDQSRNVSGHSCHTESRDVTPCLSVPIRAEPIRDLSSRDQSASPSPPQEPTEGLPKKPRKGRGSGDKKPLISMPEDWEPRSQEIAKAMAMGLSADVQASKFKNHHAAKGSRFVDWDAAFRTWLDKAEEFSAGRNGRAGAKTPLELQLERVQMLEARDRDLARGES